jgi:hypothetical protein
MQCYVCLLYHVTFVCLVTYDLELTPYSPHYAIVFRRKMNQCVCVCHTIHILIIYLTPVCEEGINLG